MSQLENSSYLESMYRSKLNFMKKYGAAKNASTGSKFDANANVENKNITTMAGEIPKEMYIGINRLLMYDKISEKYGNEIAEEYLRQLKDHEIYAHDETSIYPYCVAITMYPFLFEGAKTVGGKSEAPKHLQSFCGSFVNLAFAIAAQFAGAVATPEFLMYMDYFIRKEYGDDYYLNPDRIIDLSIIPKSLDKVIINYFEQVVYSLNEPAGARSFQSIFWNIAYFDEPYFHGMFKDFVFPDGTEPQWKSLKWLQKRFMNWFNDERLRSDLTFPVETMNLLSDGEDFVDQEMADFTAEMYAKGHSFFTYISDSVDSLSSCCFDGSQKTLTKSSDGVNYMTFKELYEAPYNQTKRNFTVFHNGSWVKGKPIRLPKRPMYKIITSNHKEIIVTDNHINPTLRGDINTTELTTNDYLLFNTCQLNKISEVDKHLTYEQGYLIGMYLGDGFLDHEEQETYSTGVHLSLNKEKYDESIVLINKACEQLGEGKKFKLNSSYNNVYPLNIYSNIVSGFIRQFVSGKYCFEKRLNLDCLLQSYNFRKGILDGYYLTDGGNNNRIYSSSYGLIEDIEVLLTSLGLQSIIDCSDRTGDGRVVIRGQSFNRNYPIYCIRWYESCNRRMLSDVYIKRNNSIYFKIVSIEPFESTDDYCYCFEIQGDEPYFTLPNGVISHNCRLRNEITDNEFSYTLGAGGVSTGSKGVMTININRLVQNAVKNNIDISDAVTEQVEKIHKYLSAYNDIIHDFYNSGLLPVYEAGYISLDRQYLTTGINGFVEGAEFLGIEISPNEEYYKYGEMILKPIYELNQRDTDRKKGIMWNTEFVPAENLGVKNAKWDKEDGYFVPRDCYNSYFYKVEDETCDPVTKMALHGKRLTRYLDGGSALHENLSEHLSKEQYKKMLKIAIKEGCSYHTYNIPNTVCNDCGHISKHMYNKCPKCGSENVDYLTRVIGYLKRVSKFSEPRIKEAEKRYYA